MARHTTLFGREMRMLCCPQCGAAMAVEVDGGLTVCGYCGTSSRLARRDDRDDGRHRPVIPEDQRQAVLRSMVGRPRVIPDPACRYAEEGQLLDGYAAHAGRRWHELHRACRASTGVDPYARQEELFFLSLLIEPRLRRDASQVRAMLESALECLDEPSFRQELRAHLVRDAVRVSDLHGAAGWLDGLDAHSTDLHADSAHRLASCFFHSARKEHEPVLDMVGQHMSALPIAFEEEGAAAMFRAHALEELGRTREARDSLHVFMATRRPDGTLRSLEVNAFLADAQLPFPLCADVYRAVSARLRGIPAYVPPAR